MPVSILINCQAQNAHAKEIGNTCCLFHMDIIVATGLNTPAVCFICMCQAAFGLMYTCRYFSLFCPWWCDAGETKLLLNNCF